MSGYSFLAEESYILLFAARLGLEIGLVYDLGRIIRRVCGTGVRTNACLDLAFWGFVGWRSFDIMHTHSNGTLRWFAVLGALAVVGLYMRFFSRYVVFLFVHMLSPVRRGFIKAKNCLTNFVKMSIIKVSKGKKKGEAHGEKNGVSDQVP